MTEWGIFNDEGLIEGGFFAVEDARAALARDYAEDGATVEEICPDHSESARETCEECAMDWWGRCADCGASTGEGTPCPHVCTEED